MPVGKRARLSLQPDDPDTKQHLLPDTLSPPIEWMEHHDRPRESQAEAMLSTLPGEDGRRFQQEHSIEDDPLDEIDIVDVETDQAELHTSDLRKRHPDDVADVEDSQDIPAMNHRGISEVVYAENKEKTRIAYAVLDTSGPVEPVYHQPSDTAIHRENKKNYLEFRETLTPNFNAKARERQGRAEHLSSACNEWQEQLRLSLQEQLREERRKRSSAIIPPLLTDDERSSCDVDLQSLVEDPLAELKKSYLTNVWDDQEKTIFREKFIEHPKKFGIIASYLDRKSVADCVQYYYLSKKSENYKQLTRKQRTKKRPRHHRARVRRASQRKALQSSVPKRDSVSSSGSSSLGAV
ncbi:hypothetical protein HPB48_017980 [Haemaphysalis longicornis]|uniref:SANT domain-containing protein n=1 Tax=Haemaphysalis longicornis TaxID=44386 RepID=A0A9J6FIR8_HAELO|nr:hypothetical protein HPB48_017980 [Haemaphysalis longicornis]